MGHMTLACGHTTDCWFAGPNVVCKDCFEAQGFVYNENSYRDVDSNRRHATNGLGTPLAGDGSSDAMAAKKRACAEILNPHLTTYDGHKGGRSKERMEARRAAYALVKERFGISRATAAQYAKEFRVAA